jgi:hypothetical protein
MSKAIFLSIFCLFIASNQVHAQQDRPDTAIENFVVYRTDVYKPFPVSGRVIGANLEIIKSGQVINICSGEATRTDENGMFHANGALKDTLVFVSPKYSARFICIKSAKERYNVILIKSNQNQLPADATESDHNKAARQDENLLKILDKDAKLEGKWNY